MGSADAGHQGGPYAHQGDARQALPAWPNGFGPNSQEVASAFWVLSKTKWTEHAGEPIRDEGITVVSSWDDALKILDRDLQRDGASRSALFY
jgi:hypothetical protein